MVGVGFCQAAKGNKKGEPRTAGSYIHSQWQRIPKQFCLSVRLLQISSGHSKSWFYYRKELDYNNQTDWTAFCTHRYLTSTVVYSFECSCERLLKTTQDTAITEYVQCFNPTESFSSTQPNIQYIFVWCTYTVMMYVHVYIHIHWRLLLEIFNKSQTEHVFSPSRRKL